MYSRANGQNTPFSVSHNGTDLPSHCQPLAAKDRVPAHLHTPFNSLKSRPLTVRWQSAATSQMFHSLQIWKVCFLFRSQQPQSWTGVDPAVSRTIAHLRLIHGLLAKPTATSHIINGTCSTSSHLLSGLADQLQIFNYDLFIITIHILLPIFEILWVEAVCI
jgi:hypothetical protein